MSQSIINRNIVKLASPFFSIRGLTYLYNEYRKIDLKQDPPIIKDDLATITITSTRNLFLFFPRKHTYTQKFDALSRYYDKERFERIVDFELRHPLVRHLVRPLYLDKITYPKIEPVIDQDRR